MKVKGLAVAPKEKWKAHRGFTKMTSERPLPTDDFGIYYVLWASIYYSFLDKLSYRGRDTCHIWKGSPSFDPLEVPQKEGEMLLSV